MQQRSEGSGLLEALRPEARGLRESGIVRAMNYGRGRQGLIPLWTGESDTPTPPFICEAAYRSMLAGETFYTYQRGIPELRAAIAAYHARMRGLDLPPERFFVTGSGMQGIQLAVQAVAGAGQEVVIPTPAWPNCGAALEILGASPVFVPFDFAAGGWRLDLDKVMAACGPRTRALYINSPSNPTGWIATREEQTRILDFTRDKGLWLIADEVYDRFRFDGPRGGEALGADRDGTSGGKGNGGANPPAPSFLEVATPEDRLLVVNTFSKNWSMTGWRMGWLAAPPEIGQVIENLIQYNTSGVAAFMQRAGVAAIEDGEGFATEQVARSKAGRDLVCGRLAGSNRVRFAVPNGAFYLLLAIEGHEDTDSLALRLIDEAGVGLAPGTAFGPGGENFMRLCFARASDGLAQAMDRLMGWIERN